MNTGAFEHIRGFGFNRFGYPGGWRGGWGGGGFGRGGWGGGFGRGCWNCGFGFGNRWGWGAGFGGWGWGGWGGWGLGWGWGSPWLGIGWGGWDPFWYDPWWNWGAGYYGYPTNNYYIYNDGGSDNYAPQDNSPAPPDQEDQYQNQNEPNYQSEPNGNWVTPNETPNEAQPSTNPGAPSLAVPVLIYMKNGSVVAVRDYWMIDNELHYILMNGVQRQVDLDRVDLARSNAENAKSGVKFIFKSEPSAPPANEAPAPPAAQPDSSAPATGVQPEART